MTRILWLSPNFNHYKARFLNRLSQEKDLDLTILAGTGRRYQGDIDFKADWDFKFHRIEVLKSQFGTSKEVRAFINKNQSAFDWILIPAEKKNILLFLYLMLLRMKKVSDFKLFSYNHPLLKSKSGRFKFIDRKLTKFFYHNLNAIIFYTEASSKLAVQKKLVEPQKAFWANNTIDTKEIDKYYSFVLPPNGAITILFIGRLIPSKRISYFLDYTLQLEAKLNEKVDIEIIGDGPDKHYIEDALKHRTNIVWHRAIVDEKLISPIMSRASLIFMPGLSGLSINHALYYGRPYATLEADRHGPEINYLKHNVNGFILDKEFENVNSILVPFLKDRKQIELFCLEAKKTGETLSVEKWIGKIKSNLLNNQNSY